MIDYQIDAKRRLVLCQVSGGLGYLALTNYIERLTHDPAFNNRFNTLVRITDAASIPGEKARAAIADVLVQWSQCRQGAKWAFVLPSALEVPLVDHAVQARGFQRLQIRSFTDEATAVAWLCEKTPAKDKPAPPSASV